MKLTLALSLLASSSTFAVPDQEACDAGYERRLGDHDFLRRSLATTALIDNGLIFLGIHDEGQLNAPGPASASGTSFVGLRYLGPRGQEEATAPGCLCEGYGISALRKTSGTSFSGSANEDDGVVCLVPEPIVSDGTTARAVATCSDLKVTHHYFPSPDTANLYQVEVTYENVGTETLTDLRYRRSMDWDIPPTEFNE